ncbi:hypothetical protein RND59_07460 [Vibrio ruber]|uniref:hypothetical protein n=1 Tax=Vibrio ruber TaxID=184755 RepID=UPI0028933389|nr:hypothetical protein [Vibrio ruber]WNJ96892.1 hypothetical protein RND59_07460 [Vibrio ruber]
MKKYKHYLRAVFIVIIGIFVIRLFYHSRQPDYYSLLLKDISASSMIKIVHGDRVIYHGQLGKDGLICLSSYKEEGLLPHASNMTYYVKVAGHHDEHYISLNINNDVLYSYKLWSKLSFSETSFHSKAKRVLLTKRCAVTARGISQNQSV